MNTTLIGRWGEAEAAAYLEGKGYRILESNYRSRYGEIDLIAAKGNIVAFVEVKLRKSPDFAAAREYVDRRKQDRLRATASMYLAQNPANLRCRFDIIEIYAPDGMNTAHPEINHMEDAFQ